MENDPPPIDPGRGRLVYDKARRTIVSEFPPARKALAVAMIRCGLATGHGDTFEDLLGEMEAQVVELQHLAGWARAQGGPVDTPPHDPQ